jgi:DNA-binding GntR family transcriptional regulator
MDCSMTLTERVRESIRDDIIDGNLRPGERLRIGALKEKYGPSATPIREALTRLAGEWIVESSGGTGFRVAGMSRADLRDVTNVRVLLECEALRVSILKGDESWEAAIVAAHHTLSRTPCPYDVSNYPRWEKLNEHFHEALVAACDSSWLLRLRRTTYWAHKRYRMLAIRETKKLEQRQDSVLFDRGDEHKQIMVAALDRDIVATCDATKKHIERTMQLICANGLLSDSC